MSTSHVHWSGKHRPSLNGEGVYPRPVQNPLPVWLGVGGTPASFARAGALGLPLMVAIIGGEHRRFRPLIDLYREAGLRAGHSLEQLKVGVHSLGYVAEDFATAANDFFPGYAESFTQIGKERGWPPMTRGHFNAQLGPTGALLVGDPETVVEKIVQVNEALGGISRLTFQMSVAALPHAKMLRAIELLGTEVAPMVRNSLASSQPQPALPTKAVRASPETRHQPKTENIMTNQIRPYDPLTSENAALVLVDHQVGLMTGVRDYSTGELKHNVVALAKAAKALKLPIVVTTTARDSMWGPTFPELVEALPGIEIIDRSSVNAFDDARVADVRKGQFPKSTPKQTSDLAEPCDPPARIIARLKS